MDEFCGVAELRLGVELLLHEIPTGLNEKQNQKGFRVLLNGFNVVVSYRFQFFASRGMSVSEICDDGVEVGCGGRREGRELR